jgi:hypothetical protein
VKLLLDVHHSRVAAQRLRDIGHDVLAASDDQNLSALEDDELLRAATRESRVVVTENARDFDRIVRTWAARAEHHGGVVFTSPRRFHRGSDGYPDNVVVALAALLDDPPDSTLDWIHWLT